MELLEKRTIRTANSTIGEFSINGEFFCYGLEPTDRGLTSAMPLNEIEAKKIPGHTAIPTGRYQVVKYFSPRHGFEVPLLVDVPGFGGVEIHIGNQNTDTDGCLLLGNTQEIDFIGESKLAVDAFYKLFFDAVNAEEQVFITYE